MSEADKMFEELGYNYQHYGNDELYYNYMYEIAFKQNKIIIINQRKDEVYMPTIIGTKVHLAIHEKMKEKGWLDV